MDKPNYTKPTSQLDLEARQEEGYQPHTVRKVGTSAEPSTTGYVAVDPIYQNAANDTDLPRIGEEGAEAKIEENFVAEDADYDAGKPPESVEESDPDFYADEEEEEETPSTTQGQETPVTPPTVRPLP